MPPLVTRETTCPSANAGSLPRPSDARGGPRPTRVVAASRGGRARPRARRAPVRVALSPALPPGRDLPAHLERVRTGAEVAFRRRGRRVRAWFDPVNLVPPDELYLGVKGLGADPLALRVVQRVLDDHRADAFAEDVDRQLGVGCRELEREVGVRDAAADGVADAAARHARDHAVAAAHRLVAEGHRAKVGEREAAERTRDPIA